MVSSNSTANLVQDVVNSNNGFSNKLYGTVSSTVKSGNIFMSPLSVHTLLALIYQGSVKSTEQNIAAVLNLPGKQETGQGYKGLISYLRNTPGVILKTANKVYVRTGLKIEPGFDQVARDYYGAEIEDLNFGESYNAARTINKWVESNTNNKIQNLIDPRSLNAETGMVLVNANYFKGKWFYPFDRKETKREPFYLSETETREVEMMNSQYEYRYGYRQDLNAQILELPYEGEKTNMIIVLPRNKTGINELERRLVTMDIGELTKDMWEAEIQVKIPKFRIESTVNLKGFLKQVG